MLLTLLIFYLIVFILLLGTFLLLDDGKESFATHMIMLGGLILWPAVVLWYFAEPLFEKLHTKADAPVERDSWL